MRLKPVVVEPQGFDYEWDGGKRYALVGKMSGYVHMVFTAWDVEQAMDIQSLYEKVREDAGYELMEVEKD